MVQEGGEPPSCHLAIRGNQNIPTEASASVILLHPVSKVQPPIAITRNLLLCQRKEIFLIVAAT